MVYKYEKQKQYKENCKERAFHYKGSKCEMCGFDEPIMDFYDFHHTDESIKMRAMTDMFGHFGWTKIKEELDKCVMVCALCHRRIHYEQRVQQGTKRAESSYTEPKCERWTKENEDRLIEMLKEGKTIAQMQEVFGGSYRRIANKRSDIKKKLSTR